MKNYTGMNVLITGSTSGIGLAIAKVFAKKNATIIFNGFASIEEINTIQADLSRITSGRVLYHGADLTKQNEIESMIEAINQDVGGVDILINNAGIQHISPIEDFPPEKWDLVLALNLSAAFHTTRLCLSQMKEKGWGRIINVASVHGLVASMQKAAYVAAKHGIIGLTKVVALETAKQDITCNAICPGWVLTPLVEKQIQTRAEQNQQTQEQATHDLLSEKQPSLSFVDPYHIGELCVFLCSDAAQQITGVALPIDGGWTAQ
ncbi:MAG: 3-hydroxybutyrate dehydrogenase [Alphaproteobacteria bacterium]|nr:3-hydroxybutyrate dehydrogenase [Alphaproteobacteria bacterium]